MLNRDKNLTTTQNYRRLGLVGRLKAPTGGAEPGLQSSSNRDKETKERPDPFAIALASETVVSEVRVERDENGKIVRVLGSSGSRRDNPLNDPLNALETDSEAEDDGFGQDGEEWDEDEGVGDDELLISSKVCLGCSSSVRKILMYCSDA